MLNPMGLLRTFGAVVNLEKLQITYAGKEQQTSSTLVLHSSGHPLMHVPQDMTITGEKKCSLNLDSLFVHQRQKL